MESEQSALILKVGLWLAFAIDAIYGLQLLLVPAVYAATIGGTPPQFGWVRWAGGMLCGLAFGDFMVARRPRGQDTFVVMTIALGFLNTLGMLIALVNGETDGALWGLWFPGAITAILSVILIVGRSQAKGVLRPA